MIKIIELVRIIFSKYVTKKLFWLLKRMDGTKNKNEYLRSSKALSFEWTLGAAKQC